MSCLKRCKAFSCKQSAFKLFHHGARLLVNDASSFAGDFFVRRLSLLKTRRNYLTGSRLCFARN